MTLSRTLKSEKGKTLKNGKNKQKNPIADRDRFDGYDALNRLYGTALSE